MKLFYLSCFALLLSCSHRSLPAAKEQRTIALIGLHFSKPQTKKLVFKDQEGERYKFTAHCPSRCASIKTTLIENLKPGKYTLIDLLQKEKSRWKHLEFEPFDFTVSSQEYLYLGHWSYHLGQWTFGDEYDLLQEEFPELKEKQIPKAIPLPSFQ